MKTKIFFTILLSAISGLSAKAQWQRCTADTTVTDSTINAHIPAVRSAGVNGNYIFAGSYYYGLFLSTDSANSWHQAQNTINNNISIYSIGFSGGYTFAATDNGVWVSVDNGASWTLDTVGMGLAINSGYFPIPLLVTGNKIFVGTFGGGVYESVNNGGSWSMDTAGMGNQQVSSLSARGDTIFAGINNGEVFLSINNGASWTSVSNGLPGVWIRSLAISDTNVYAGTNGSGVYKSTNDGASWAAINTGFTGSYVRTLITNGNDVFAGTDGGGIFLSSDRGANWSTVNAGIPLNAYVYSLAIGNNTLYAGTDSGLYVSDDYAQSWARKGLIIIRDTVTHTNTYDKVGSVSDFAVSGNNILAATSGRGVSISPDNGITWIPINTGLTSQNINAVAFKGTDIYAGTNVGMFKSTDTGAHWVRAGLTNMLVGSVLVSGANIFAYASDTLFSSSSLFFSPDNGNSWTDLVQYIVPLAASGANIFGTDNMGNGVFLSADSGANWTTLGSPVSAYVKSLAVNGNYFYAGISNGLYYSADSGSNWIHSLAQDSAAGFNPGLVNSIVINGANVFAGTTSGVYHSYDSGKTWIAVTTGLPSGPIGNPITALAVSGNYVFASTTYNGIWKRPLSDFPCSNFAFSLNVTDAANQTTNDGSIAVVVSGGLTPYNYSWSNGSTDTSVTGLAAGTSLCITVSDAASCATSACDSVGAQNIIGINDPVNLNVSIYPNPAHDEFELLINNNGQYSNTLIAIYNLLGEKAQEEKVTFGNRTSISIKALTSGIYFVKASDGQKQFTQKLIIQ